MERKTVMGHAMARLLVHRQELHMLQVEQQREIEGLNPRPLYFMTLGHNSMKLENRPGVMQVVGTGFRMRVAQIGYHMGCIECLERLHSLQRHGWRIKDVGPMRRMTLQPDAGSLGTDVEMYLIWDTKPPTPAATEALPKQASLEQTAPWCDLEIKREA